MTISSVLGGGPVSILLDGKQYGIPLSLLAIKDGAIDASRVSDPPRTDATKVIEALYRSAALTAGTAAAKVLALTLRSKIAGPSGNSIVVTFDDVQADEDTPEDSLIEFTIVYEDVREDQTPVSLGEELGTPGGGTSPGLAAMKTSSTILPEAAGPTPFTEVAAGQPLEVTFAAEDGSGDAFTLQAVGAGAMLADMTVETRDVDVAAGTFTLEIRIEHSPAAAVTLADLGDALEPLVEVEPGPDGLAAPAEGIVTFSGGAAATSTTSASAEATVLTN
jgi:hypothetical protein